MGKTLHQPLVDTTTGEIIVADGTVLDEKALLRIEESDGSPIKVTCNAALPYTHRTITREDIMASISYLLNLMDGHGHTDDIDHLGNRRLRSVGELLQNQFRIGLSRMERVALINIRPVVAAIKEFLVPVSYRNLWTKPIRWQN
ncbi:hypothetical protein Lal_00045301 [Lupinus albus]|nr:hypothetical protein Lal_00045301 [Lupinus albus]